MDDDFNYINFDDDDELGKIKREAELKTEQKRHEERVTRETMVNAVKWLKGRERAFISDSTHLTPNKKTKILNDMIRYFESTEEYEICQYIFNIQKAILKQPVN